MFTLKVYILIILTGLSLFFCTEPTPTQKDGFFTIQVYVADTSGLLNSGSTESVSLTNTNVLLESRSYFENFDNSKRYLAKTNAGGIVSFNNIPASEYTLSILKDTTYMDDRTGNTIDIRLSSFKSYDITTESVIMDSAFTALSPKNSLVINEIYYAGPVNKSYYFYDQFVELYNTADTAVYLDGLILCRALQDQHINMETNDFVQAIYVFQFPGDCQSGREYPLEPGQFIVVAQDAYNHSQFIPNALDLSDADWEFFTPFGGEIDNPAPNVTNILPERTQDFMINLGHNAVILAKSLDWYYGETGSSGKQYVHIPIKSVIDVVEYASNFELQKEITIRLDAGFAGVGMQKYSGKSVERREPGFDSNNSNIDFVIIDTPTPGYQH